MILFVLPAATIYDRQNRVMGWKSTPPSRDAIKELRAIVPRLRELGATKVIACDLLSDSGKLLARRLNVPYEEWSSLRRFNVGKHHGCSVTQWDDTKAKLDTVWVDKPDVPVKGGDSKTSFAKRVATAHERLKKVNDCTVIVADPTMVQALTHAAIPLERNRVYQWQTN